MGAIHKLKPEVKDFLLEQKKCNSALSCRKLTVLVLDNFKVDLSKSSINAIIKEAGLSAPVGRTPKKRRRRTAMSNLPLLLETEIASSSAAEVGGTPRNDEESPETPRDGQAVTVPSAEPLLKKVQEEAEQEAKEAADKKAQEEAEQKAKLEAEEAARKAEEEKWIRLAEEEKRAKEEAVQRIEQESATAAALSVERAQQLENTGIVLLRAADSIIGAGKLIAAAIKSRLPKCADNFEDLTESIIYLPLLQEGLEKNLMDRLSGYLNELDNIKVMNLDIARIMTLGLQEVRCVKVILSDASQLYLDGQMYSIWSSPHIPYDFGSPIHSLKKYIHKYFDTDSPFILFNAPGYDLPSPEFFTFLAGLEAKGNNITNLVLYGNKLEELEVLPIAQAKKHSFVFGIWSWQFTECRKVKSIGEFRQFHLEEQNKDLYIAEIEMQLEHPGIGKQMTLYGCAVKLSLSEKTRMVILSNFIPGDKKAEELTALYFNHWPNPDEAFQDYSRKIELFTYTANSQRYFSPENLNLGLTQVSNARDLFRDYLTALDAFVRWHLLPSGYEDKELSLTKEQFYDLNLQLTKNNESCRASFKLPSGYAAGKDLGYLCHRVNEREVILDGKRFLLEP